ncbi:type I polyketide synthase [Shewanella aegiceratis]|uniref:type I polyketide synthase n=1 Tax=Shewanella aegiceratis TaxID=2864203 RepID=UPI001C65C6C1|nr:type I polyketide synthase [Shewanella aegiceratis]QYJ81347.1 KR domain-containing protein [Shewanella aegiceratis]
MSQTETSKTSSDQRLNKRLKDMPIAIVGMASIFANSRYLNKFWDLICDKIDAITEVPDTHWQVDDYYDSNKSAPDKSYCKRGGFMPEVNFNPMEFGLPPNILELTDTSQLLSLIVAKEVLADAKLPSDYDRNKIGITLGVGGGQKISHSLNARLQYPVLKKVFKHSGISDADSEMLIKKFQDQYVHWEENSFPGSLGNVIAGRIANRFDLGGMNCVVDAACAGSLAAMRMALSELVDGRAEMMITGGVCTDNSPSMYMSFSKTPAFTTNETVQPFDIDSKGMMIGEGIGMVALKRLEDAERDGDRIYAVIKGVGASSDGKFKSIYAPRPEGQAKALKRAYDDAGFPPHTLGLMEAHGTGTAAGDVAEFNGLKSVFSEGCETTQHIALGSVKSQIGHTKSTAGTAGLIKAALALHHKVLPPTINVDQPNPKLDIANSPFYLNTETRPWLPRPDGTPRRAGISSFGFGGTNFHFVLEEYQSDHGRDLGKLTQFRQRAVPQSLLLSAADKTGLIATIRQLVADAEQQSLYALAAQHPLRALDANAPRLGLVASDTDSLKTQLNQALSRLEAGDEAHWSLPGGLHYRSSSLTNPKMAALFAGQGAQYLNMGLELACHFPEMREQFVIADKVFASQDKTPLSQLVYPVPVFTTEQRKAQEALLTNTANAQSAIGAISMGQYTLLKQAGFTPDMVAGHSFGELSALCAAGVIGLEDYYQLTFARGDAMASPSAEGADRGTMYAIITKTAEDLTRLESTLETFEGVKVANYNAPTQLVIAGPTESTTQAAKALSELGFKAIALPVSGAFHTPLVGHAQAPFAEAIDKVKFAKPALPVYANASGARYANVAKTIKNEFKQHMLQSVRFSEQLEAMYADGARVFVEFGPKNILQKLVENTLSDKLDTLCTISLNPNPKGDSDLQLRQGAMQLAVCGIALDEIDPYQAEPAQAEPVSPMNITLNATNYISPATLAKMEKSLNTGTITPQTRVQEKIVEVEKLVEVEKVVEKFVEVEKIVEKSIPAALAPQANDSHGSVINTPAIQTLQTIAGDDALTALFAAQQQTAQLHQQFLTIPQQYGETVTQLMTAQAQMAAAGVAIPESLQRAMEQFHQHQAQTLQSHTQFLEMQAQSNQSALQLMGQGGQPLTPRVQAAPLATPVIQPQSLPAETPAVQSAPVAASAPVIQQVQQAPQTPVVAAPVHTAEVQAPVPATPSTAAKSSADEIQKTMLEVVADKTGYPTEMLSLEMDMEADLGIDSIKRVEILGTVQDELPGLPELSPEDLAECRTLDEIVAYMESKLPAAGAHITETAAGATQQAAAGTVATIEVQNTATSGLSSTQVQETMLTVVADKTGYPTEMLSLEMDMEADLGIDSIKRVEILGTVQDELPALPELSPEDLAECRTLGEIVSYMNSKLPVAGTLISEVTTGAVATPEVQNTATSGLSSTQVQETMLTVVADKTGYPTEMLSLEMDMEADLGIDSIKRVEILGTVQDELPELPDLSPEDLAECRTLGEIVSYMNSKLPAAGAHIQQATAGAHVQQAAGSMNSQQPTAGAPIQQAAAGLSSTQVQETMLSVVADKTGYPTEMLALEMDMEADLGIDSIKRVEILGTVQDELPGLPDLNPEDLAECRTLGEIVAYMNSKLPAAGAHISKAAAGATVSPEVQSSVATDSLSSTQVQQTMLSVVADKTGYPTEMLALEMDMEADLGIDSIKRVEILGTVQDELPGLPDLSPEDLAECRTLGEIVAYMNSKLPAAGTHVQQTAAGALAETTGNQEQSVSVTQVQAISAEPLVELPPHSEVALKKLEAAKPDAEGFAANATLVIQDDGHNAGVLAEKLSNKGLKVVVLRLPEGQPQSPLSSAIASWQPEGLAEQDVMQAIAGISADHGNIAGFVHLQPQQEANAVSGLQLSDAGFSHLSSAFLWAKHLQAPLSAQTGRRCFVTVSRIDGGFGYLDAKQLAKSELNQAALSGLTKTLSHEWPGIFCRALDLAPEMSAAQLGDALLAELMDSDSGLNEVGISVDAGGKLCRHRLQPGEAAIKTAESQLDSSDKILVTGGAKGVTFECALALAKRCQSHFILAGRSEHVSAKDLPEWAQGKTIGELKQAAIAHIMASGDKPTPKQVDALIWPVKSSLEIQAALNAFEAVGASAEYLAMDVSKAEAIEQALGAINQLTPITGLIHGAGVLADKHIQDKTLDELGRVYGTKVAGLKALLSVIDPAQLKLVALFSSAAGFYGNTGQSDYAMANEILNKAALQLTQLNEQTKVMSFNWGPWDGGMVNPALKKMFVDRGVYVIPLQAGAELFATQLLGHSGVQLLIGSDMQGNTAKANEVSSVKKPDADEVHVAQHPLPPVTLTRQLTPATMAFVSDHVIGGNPVLPTVCAIQWMREAARAHIGAPVKVRSYKLLKGIIFDTEAPQTLVLTLTPEYKGDSLTAIQALISSEGRPQYQASLCLMDSEDSSAPIKAFEGLYSGEAVTDASTLYSDGTLFHGPRLQGLDKVVRFDEQGLLASVSLPQVREADCGEFVPSLSSAGCQPFAEDLLLQAMLVWARLSYGAASLPSAIDEFISVQPMHGGETGYIELNVDKSNRRSLTADVALYHQDGRLSALMKGARITISSTLNAAFVPHGARGETANEEAMQ